MMRRELLKTLHADQILEAIGLERRNPYNMMGQALGVFGVGILVGSVLGLMFAPKAGGALRSDIAGRFEDMRGRFSSEGVDKQTS